MTEIFVTYNQSHHSQQTVSIAFAFGAQKANWEKDFFPYSRCSVGDLTDEEFELFEIQSDIENDPYFTLHKGIVLDSLESKSTHLTLLQRFVDDIESGREEGARLQRLQRIAAAVRDLSEKPGTDLNVGKQKRRTKAERRGLLEEAIDYHIENPSLPQAQVAEMFKLESTALSKEDAVLLIMQRTPKTSSTRPKVSKAIADDFIYNEKR